MIIQKGDENLFVKVYHWWPGRTYRGDNPFPENVINMAVERGTRYMTMAVYDDKVGLAKCCPWDFPRRSLGRSIAVGKLLSKLE